MPQAPRRPLIRALRQACLAAPLVIGLSQSVHAYSWEAVDLNKDVSTTEAWYNVETKTTWMSPLTFVGELTFANAQSKVQNLNYFGTTGWRLPFLGVTDTNKTPPGELGLVFDSFGSVAELSKKFLPSGQSLSAQRIWYGDMPGSDRYFLWVGTAGGSVSTGSTKFTDWTGLAWAVHDGDLRSITASVPEPHESTMLLSGVLALGFMARRRRATDKRK
jgi:hypothetical protein